MCKANYGGRRICAWQVGNGMELGRGGVGDDEAIYVRLGPRKELEHSIIYSLFIFLGL